MRLARCFLFIGIMAVPVVCVASPVEMVLESAPQVRTVPASQEPLRSILRGNNRSDRSFGFQKTILVENAYAYVLFSKGVLGQYSADEGEYVSSSHLTGWKEYLTLQGESPAGGPWMQGPWGDVEDPSAFRLGEEAVWYSRQYTKQWAGCLAQSPLRYGDVNGDRENELVLFVRNDLVIFSPAEGGIVFSANFANRDEAFHGVEAGMLEDDELPLAPRYQKLGDEAPQYVAHSGLPLQVWEILPAWRSFAKFYFGDFSEDERQDIVMWRKLYESRTLGDPVEGYSLKAEGLVHYIFEEGQYRLQETPQDEIRTWLTDHELTWARGYPSYSECEGEEGQLIPEMHDPLLNDPEVLEGVDPETMTLIENEED